MDAYFMFVGRTNYSERCFQLVLSSDQGKSNKTLALRTGENAGSISQHLNFGRTLLSQDERNGMSSVGELFNMYQAQETPPGEHSAQVLSKELIKFKGVKAAPEENVLAFIKHYLMPVDAVIAQSAHNSHTRAHIPCPYRQHTPC